MALKDPVYREARSNRGASGARGVPPPPTEVRRLLVTTRKRGMIADKLVSKSVGISSAAVGSA